MSRQRLRPSLVEFSHIVCPRCSGNGAIRSVESLSLSILRLMEEEAMKESTAKVVVQVPVDAATFLLNEKRREIWRIEDRHDVSVIVIPNMNLETPHYQVQRIREQDAGPATQSESSYKLVAAAEPEASVESAAMTPRAVQEEPAVKDIHRQMTTPAPNIAEAAAPVAESAGGGGFVRRIFAMLFGAQPRESAPPASTERAPRQERAQPSPGRRGQPRQDQRRDQQRDRRERRDQAQRRDDAQRRQAPPAQQGAQGGNVPSRPEQPVREREEVEDAGSDESRRGRRGRRGGRNRNRRREGERIPAPASQSAVGAAAGGDDGIGMPPTAGPDLTPREPIDAESSRDSEGATPQVTEFAPVPVDHRLAFVPEDKPVAEQPAPTPLASFPAERSSRPEPGDDAASAAVRSENASPHESSTGSHG
jgi:ribonuclease E